MCLKLASFLRFRKFGFDFGHDGAGVERKSNCLCCVNFLSFLQNKKREFACSILSGRFDCLLTSESRKMLSGLVMKTAPQCNSNSLVWENIRTGPDLQSKRLII